MCEQLTRASPPPPLVTTAARPARQPECMPDSGRRARLRAESASPSIHIHVNQRIRTIIQRLIHRSSSWTGLHAPDIQASYGTFAL